MTDKVHPAATKPNATAAAAAPPTLKPPPSKTQLPNPTRHPNRPPPTAKHFRKNRPRRRCLCLACFWFTLLLLAIFILTAVAAAAFYALYRPQKPLFSVTSVKITSLNLTTSPSDDTARLSTKLNLTLSAKNPNKKMAFSYESMSITAQFNSVTLPEGSYTKFTNSPDTVFIIHSTLGSNSQVLETEAANALRADLKKKKGLAMSIVVDTMVAIKMDKWKMKKIGIRVKCVGIRGVVHANSNVSKAKCKVGLRVKIFKWSF